MGKGFLRLLSFLWPITISPRNASLGSSRRRKMVKAYFCGNFPLQIMLKMLDDSWCAETSFPKKTIPSSCSGEYKCCYVTCNRQIHILITISCVKTSHVLQNPSCFSFAPLVCVFLVTTSCKFVLNYVLKIVIIFAFCMISLPNSSKYVLIDISSLTHFLSRNLFVMSFLIPQANGKFRECSGNSLTITVNYSVWMVNVITNIL